MASTKEQYRCRLKFDFAGEAADEIEMIREFYSEPVSKVLHIDILAVIKKHVERIKTPPSEFLIKK